MQLSDHLRVARVFSVYCLFVQLVSSRSSVAGWDFFLTVSVPDNC